MDKNTHRAHRADRWDSARAYEPYVGRWSRLVAREFVQGLAVPPGGRWLDVGCGTGVLVRAALAHAAPREVVGVDPSETYIASASAQIDNPRTRF
jgi:ubiquinone/menaquinone biosynthesis C-methylase UbiE